MANNKVECMKVARKFDKDFWDGQRKYGMEVINIPGLLKPLVWIINYYGLNNSSKILEVGCGDICYTKLITFYQI